MGAKLRPIPEWLWIGRVVRCVYGISCPFEGEGTVRRHAEPGTLMHGCVLVRHRDGEGWFAPEELTPSGGSQQTSNSGEEKR